MRVALPRHVSVACAEPERRRCPARPQVAAGMKASANPAPITLPPRFEIRSFRSPAVVVSVRGRDRLRCPIRSALRSQWPPAAIIAVSSASSSPDRSTEVLAVARRAPMPSSPRRDSPARNSTTLEYVTSTARCKRCVSSSCCATRKAQLRHSRLLAEPLMWHVNDGHVVGLQSAQIGMYASVSAMTGTIAWLAVVAAWFNSGS